MPMRNGGPFKWGPGLQASSQLLKEEFSHSSLPLYKLLETLISIEGSHVKFQNAETENGFGSNKMKPIIFF